jgi:Zn-dependent protease with chaperone function
MNDLSHTLHHMGALQLALALVFLGSYAMLLGGFFEGRAQWVAGFTALGSSMAFVARTSPWEHGVLLVMCVVVGMAAFIVLAWMLTRLAGRATGGADYDESIARYPLPWLEEDEAQLQAEFQGSMLDVVPMPTPSYAVVPVLREVDPSTTPQARPVVVLTPGT